MFKQGVTPGLSPMTSKLLGCAVWSWPAIVLALDTKTPLGVADGMLYVPALLLTSQLRNPRSTLVYGALCSVMLVVGIVLSPRYPGVPMAIPFTNRAFSLLAIWTVTFLVCREVKSRLRIQHLERLVRMSAWTKQVLENGDWISIEEFLKKHFGIDVTHTIDPESADKMMRDLESGLDRGADAEDR